MPGAPKEHHTTPEERLARRAVVRQALARAENTFALATRLAAQWGCHRGTIDTYIREVREEAAQDMMSRGDPDRAAALRELEDGLKDVIAEARAAKDRKSAIAASRELLKIHGGYAAERVEVTGPGGAPLLPAPTIDLTGYSEHEVQAFLRIVESLAPRALPDQGAGPRAAIEAGAAESAAGHAEPAGASSGGPGKAHDGGQDP